MPGDASFAGEQLLKKKMDVINSQRTCLRKAEEKKSRDLRHNATACEKDKDIQRMIWAKEDEFEEGSINEETKAEREAILRKIEDDYEISNAVINKRVEATIMLTKREVLKSLQGNEEMLTDRREKLKELIEKSNRALKIVDADLRNVRKALKDKEREIANSPIGKKSRGAGNYEEEDREAYCYSDYESDGMGSLKSDEEWEYYSDDEDVPMIREGKGEEGGV